MSPDRSPEPKVVKAMPAVPGWEELASCTNLVSFNGKVYLTLFEDHAVTLNKEKSSSDQMVGKWSFDETSQQYALTLQSHTDAYKLVSPEGTSTCMLIKGDLDAADLKSSWYSLISDDAEPVISDRPDER